MVCKLVSKWFIRHWAEFACSKGVEFKFRSLTTFLCFVLILIGLLLLYPEDVLSFEWLGKIYYICWIIA